MMDEQNQNIHTWCPTAIVIAGVGTKGDVVLDKDHIPDDFQYNLMDVFCLENEPLKATVDFEPPSVYFSPKKFPPNTDSWDIISKVIKDAAMYQGNTQLSRARTASVLNKKTGEYCTNFYFISSTFRFYLTIQLLFHN